MSKYRSGTQAYHVTVIRRNRRWAMGWTGDPVRDTIEVMATSVEAARLQAEVKASTLCVLSVRPAEKLAGVTP